MTDDGSDDDTRLTREVTLKAIRRLDVLEWVMTGGAVLLALAGGALVAFVLDDVVAWGFRTLWAVASLFLFIVPSAATFFRLRRENAELDRRLNPSNDDTHG